MIKFTNFWIFPIFLVLIATFPWRTWTIETIVPYSDCGSPGGEVLRLEVIPICEREICKFRKGENVSVIAEYVIRKSTETLYLTAYAQDLNMVFQYETLILHKHSICGKYNASCPIEGSEEIRYGLYKMKIPPNVPNFRARLRIVLLGDNDQQIICGRVPVEVL